MPGAMLYAWGPLHWEVWPFNVGEIDHQTQTAWSRKEILGAASYREWVGEDDETIQMRGKVFPHFFSRAARRFIGPVQQDISTGGLSQLDLMDNMRRLGQAHTLIRGDGWYLGWFVIEKMSRGHTYLGADGIGKQITFEATFQRVPVPRQPAGYYSSLWTTANAR